MLTAHHLSKSFELQTLFKDATFSINPGDRIGLVGANGAGKTTLLRTIVGGIPRRGHCRDQVSPVVFSGLPLSYASWLERT